MQLGIEYYTKKRPHVVILGAGASCAAIPHGDKFGKKISAMNGFIDKLGLSDIIANIDFHTSSNNLEDMYMELDDRSHTDHNCQVAKNALENRIYSYMSSFRIPDFPTVYDFLLLSLTSKDLVATFNWDPLLVQSYLRIMKFTDNLPEMVFLHGNVAIGYCENDNTIGNIGTVCKCGKPLKPIQLLYPIKKKDYSSETAIAKSWKTLQNAMKAAYMVTIFGYSAPKSDVAAISMLKSAWGKPEERNLEEIEIIDLRSEDDLKPSWEEFIYSHHYSCHKSFFDSTLGTFPRRSCEAFFDMVMGCRFLNGEMGFSPKMSFSDIYNLIHPLLSDEQNKKGKKLILNNPYV